MPGAAFEFKGSIDGSVGANSGAAGARVDQVEIRIDIEAAAIIDHTVSFSANGALTFGATVATDATVPSPPTSKGCKIQTAAAIGTPVFTSIAGVRTITITITSDNKRYVDADSAGQAKRTAGNIDFTVSYSVYTADFSAAEVPLVNTVANLRVFVDATTFWDLKWCKYADASDLGVPVESADNVAATLNVAMEGFTDVDGTTPTEGFIKNPAAATFWPV